MVFLILVYSIFCLNTHSLDVLKERDRLFDSDWRFVRGDSAPLHCSTADFPVDLGQTQCMGLTQQAATTAADCEDICCNQQDCHTWQFCPSGEKCASYISANSCWIGQLNNCKNTTDGWISRARQTSPSNTCTLPFCQPSFDDSSWMPVEVPHDWSITDLPPRISDSETPVLAVRNGTWLFHKGDNTSWSSPTFSDRDWTKVTIPSDWRDAPLNYFDKNAIGWYRRHLKGVTKDLVDYALSGNLRLGLGTVAAADETFLNGHSIGKTGYFGKNPQCQSYLTYRSYQVPGGILQEGDGNVVAVRVFSQGGLANTSHPGFPGGLYDTELPDQRVGPFDPAASPGKKQTGYTVGGYGWYRKHFVVDDAKDSTVALRFDGVYMNAEFWLNGQLLGHHPYGYTTFQFEITSFLKPAQTNVLAIRISNIGENSRWYSGSGIFRHVWLTVTPKVHIALWGVSVTTPNLSPTNSATSVVTTVRNDDTTLTHITVHTQLFGPDGTSIVSNTTKNIQIAANGTSKISQNLVITNPLLWSPKTPNLYHAKVTVSTESTSDTVNVTYGFRSVSVSAEKGFVLNGVSIKMQGGCVHHDNGPLGSASIDRADERRVELLKANGYNAIRTSHNPPSPAFLDACDRFGILVMDEAFDCWENGKNPQDYHLYFDEWWERDITSMVLRDQNHPSVVIWSIGNEIPERATPKGVQTATKLRKLIRSLDPQQRPVTSAYPQPNPSGGDPFFAVLDIAGYNYEPNVYVTDHKRVPSRVIASTESFPLASFESWVGVWDNSWVIGDFIWTAIDYIGESAIGANGHNTGNPPDLDACGGYCPLGWSYHISFCGDLDIVGHKKPQSYYRNVLWNVSQLEIAVHAPIAKGQKEVVAQWGYPDERQSWTWSPIPSDPLKVNVYSQYDHVMLLVNGVPVSADPTPVSRNTKFTASYSVPYVPGELTAVGYIGGKPIANKTIRTTGTATQLRLTADRQTIRADRSDLAYVTVEILDNEDRCVPNAAIEVHFVVSGAGELAAVGNGDPVDAASFHLPIRRTYQGRAMVILRPGNSFTQPWKGVITLQAQAQGLKSDTISINTQ